MKLLTLFLVLGSLSAFASQECFERSYSAEHLKKQPKQAISKIEVRIDKGSEYGDFLAMKVVSSQGNLEYDYYARKIADGVYCAEGMGDGDQYRGCAIIKTNKSGKTYFSPTEYREYKDELLALDDSKMTVAYGMDFLRCEGVMTDGEGCLGAQKILRLLPSNEQDMNYRLNKIKCK